MFFRSLFFYECVIFFVMRVCRSGAKSFGDRCDIGEKKCLNTVTPTLNSCSKVLQQSQIYVCICVYYVSDTEKITVHEILLTINFFFCSKKKNKVFGTRLIHTWVPKEEEGEMKNNAELASSVIFGATTAASSTYKPKVWKQAKLIVFLFTVSLTNSESRFICRKWTLNFHEITRNYLQIDWN